MKICWHDWECISYKISAMESEAYFKSSKCVWRDRVCLKCGKVDRRNSLKIRRWYAREYHNEEDRQRRAKAIVRKVEGDKKEGVE
jgi:hypothetical protein